MAGTPATYNYETSDAERYKNTVAQLFETTRRQFPNAWAKMSPPFGVSQDDGEFNVRLAWACRQAGVPCYVNGKRGNVNDRSHDILVFQNPTGVKDNSGRLAGLTLIDFVTGHQGPNAAFGWLDVTVVTDQNPTSPTFGQRIMPPAATIVPFEWDDAEPSEPSRPPCAPLPNRGEAMEAGRWLDAFYSAPEGLQRHEGLSIGGRPDWEGVGAWLFDVWLKARTSGKSEHDARALVVAAIQQTDEWKRKHP